METYELSFVRHRIDGLENVGTFDDIVTVVRHRIDGLEIAN